MHKIRKSFSAFTAFCVFLSVISLSGIAAAQEEPQLNHYFSIQIKSGMGREFEEFIKTELNPALRKGGVTESTVWKTAVFGTAGQYIITEPVTNLEQYDQPNPLLKALGEKDFEKMMDKMQKYIRSTEMLLVVMRPDLGVEVPSDYVPKLAVQVRIEVSPGRGADYEEGTKQVMGVVKTTNAKGAYAARVLLGGNPNEYHTVVLLDSFTDMAQYGTEFSKGMSEAKLTPQSGIVDRMEYKVYARIPELSIRPSER